MVWLPTVMRQNGKPNETIRAAFPACTNEAVQRCERKKKEDNIEGRVALNIKDERTDQLARAVAKQSGESLTKAIRVALEERLQRLTGRRHAATRKEKLYEILHRVDKLPRVDERSDDEILGYDENGIPH